MSLPAPQFPLGEHVIHRDRSVEGTYVVVNALYRVAESEWWYHLGSRDAGGGFVWVKQKDLLRQPTPHQEQRERDLRWFVEGWRARAAVVGDETASFCNALVRNFRVQWFDGTFRWPDGTRVELP